MLRLSHNKLIYDVARTCEQMLSIRQCFVKLDQSLGLDQNSRPVNRRRTFYCIVGSLIGLCLNSAAAMANNEEVSNDFGESANSISSLSKLSIDLWTDESHDLSSNDIVNSHLDNAIIPETVWSLRRDTPIHVDRIRDGIASAIYTESGVHFNNQASLIRSAFGLWIGNSIYESGDLIAVSPLQFQVASCGGTGAERKGLDYCALGSNTLREAIEQQILSDNYDKLKSEDANNDDVLSPKNGSSSSNATGQSPPPSPTLTPVADAPSHSGLITFDPCGGGVGICTIVNFGITETPHLLVNPPLPTDGPTQIINDLAPPVGDLAPPVGDLAPPVGDLAPPLGPIVYPDPVFSAPPSLNPIPEASTWVMTMIGFSLMVLAVKKKRRPRFNPVSFIDLTEV